MSTKERIKKGFEVLKNPFRDDIEEFARENAIYSINDYKESNVKDFLAKYELEPVGAGLNARVFKIKNKNWVIKEARWDLNIKLFSDKAKIPLPAKLAQNVMNIFSFQFLPNKKNSMQDYSSYLEFSQYFGYYDEDSDFPHPNLELISTAQKNIRETLLFFKPAIERKYSIKLPSNIDDVLNSDVKYHNFLPREYQLMGESISKENKGKVTSYIFQQFVKGDLLAEIPDKNLSRETKLQLILLVYLVFLMHMQIGLLPDTKPRKPMFNAYNWLTKTDNIIVSKDKLIFIDTRWFWDTNANIVKRGVLIPDLMINRAKYSLLTLLDDI